MILAIIGIAGFQAYWMRNLYRQEWAELKKETDLSFRDAVYKLQMQRLRSDTLFTKHHLPPNIFLFNLMDSIRTRFVDSFAPSAPLLHDRNVRVSFQVINNPDSLDKMRPEDTRIQIQDQSINGDSGVTHLLKIYNSRTGSEPPLSIGKIDSAYRLELAKNRITVPFQIDQMQQGRPLEELDRPGSAGKLQTTFVYAGLTAGYAYQANFGSPVRYLLGRMLWPIVAGGFLLGFTVLAFVVLHRNLRQQRRLAQYKNDFISNMTHELKTPMSTIKVAVEALRHFDALDDPKRTREYLDISAMELQRLSLLVDKVLKLSQFENNEMEFRLTVFDLRELAAEVIGEMRLPFEKAGAVVRLVPAAGWDSTGLKGVAEAFPVRGDRGHLSSVISNLLDNAVKYSRESPVVTVEVSRAAGWVILSVTDNGIGIPAEYAGRVFDKFFRVPSGDHHNIKGYGLGLNYVHHIVHAHRGEIDVESKEGKGSRFTVKLRAYEQNQGSVRGG
jgi:two-component system phosphate regulon sensor histidine kinase PhoR